MEAQLYTVFSDLPEHTAAGGGSIPPEICVTAEKPDIVILDNCKETSTGDTSHGLAVY